MKFVFWLLTFSVCFRINAGDSVVVFNELMFQPGQGDAVEWIELHNQMAVDVELSGWRIQGVDYTFPTNTIIAGGRYVVIASDPVELMRRAGVTNVLGPFTGRLANEGETLTLRNQNDRVMDTIDFEPDEPWPSGPSGSGFTLAKRLPILASDPAGNWTHSATPGGTPGASNAVSSSNSTVVFNELPSIADQPYWLELRNLAPAAIDAGGYEIGFSRAFKISHKLPAGTTIAAGGHLVVEIPGVSFQANEKAFLFAAGGTNLLDAGEIGARLKGRLETGRWGYPSAPTPGGTNSFAINRHVVINEIMFRNRPLEAAPAEYAEEAVVPMNHTWRYEQSGGNPGANWAHPGFSDNGWPSGNGAFALETAALPAPVNTPLKLGPITYYFRAEFDFAGDTNGVELVLEHMIDDGAVFSLNGEEIYRFNMPDGPVSRSTLATPGVGDAVLVGPIPLPAKGLRNGRNLLAVEVHQGSTSSTDIVFGCKASVRHILRPAHDFLESSENWIELLNTGPVPVDLTGWRLDGVDYDFSAGTLIQPGAFLVIAQNADDLRAKYPNANVVGDFQGRLSRGSEFLELRDNLGNVVDDVRYFDAAPWPELAEATGSSLELTDPAADNSAPEAWAASREAGPWRTYEYTAIARPDNGPTLWKEFIFGLLDAGEALFDDFSVIEDPNGAARELLQNGSFNNGPASWRFLGTHRKANIIADPDNPANNVLRLVADGPTEHMHNHVETTLVNNSAIRNGTLYKIAFRAKWLAGCNKVNTRLYFNRVAKTTNLERPAKTGTPGERNSTAVANLGPTFSQLAHHPLVPRATDPVEVSVRASDPDGLKNCTLWWQSTGSGWNSLPMTIAGDRYTASIPSRTASTVVQFYIEGTDQRGAASFYPAGGRESRARYKVNDGQSLSTRLHNVRLWMTTADANSLHAPTNVMSNGRSRCTVVYNDAEVFYDCAIHLQASERGRMESDRVGFTVSFPADHLFRGVHDTITFDRSGGWSGRGGRQDEIVMRHIINQAGDSPDMYNDLVRVLTPLSTHNGTAMLLMAKYGGEFLDGSRYPADGSLFKYELIYSPTTSVGNDPQRPKIPLPDEVVGVEIGNFGDDPEAYRWFFLAENHPWMNDYKGMMEVAKTFSLSGAALHQRTAELMDMDQWTRVLALKTLSGDADTYGWGYPHNQIFYVPFAGKALTFPWDMDFAWVRATTDPLNVGGRLGQIVHGIPEYHRLFLGHVHDILGSVYNTNYMARWTAHYGSLAGQNYSGVLTYIGQRSNSAKSQLPAQASYRITSPSAQNLITNSTSVLLRGTAPYTIRGLDLPGHPGAGFRWTSTDAWDTTIPLRFGPNLIEVVAYNFRGLPVATNSITITSTRPFGHPDSDGDRLPDHWELENGSNPEAPDAQSDPDGDGLTNIQEYLAGTNPNERADCLTLQSEATAGGLILRFIAQGGRAYRLQTASDLNTTWSDLKGLPPAQSTRAEEHFVPSASSRAFFRLLLEVPQADR